MVDPAVIRTTWFEHARERFEREGEYPLIDDADVVKWEDLHDFWPWEERGWSSNRSAEELCQQALRSDLADLPVRFVYLNLFYRLAHYPAEELAVVVEDQEAAAKYRAQFLDCLKTLVWPVEASGCEDPRRVRWEIVNACVIRDWDLARRLYNRLEELAGKDELVRLSGQRGEQEFLSVLADRCEIDGPCCWAPLPEQVSDERVLRVGRYLLCLCCVADHADGSFTDEEIERLRDAAHHLEKAIRGRHNLAVLLRFLLLRCNLILGKFEEAATGCEELLAYRGGLAEVFHSPEIVSDLVADLYSRLVEAHRSAGQVERAISANQRWIEEYPDQPGTFERLSLLFAEQGDLKKAYECLRKEVDRNTALGEDPRISLALRYGAVYRDPADRAADFETRTDPEKLRNVEVVARALWPEVENLDDRNIQDWVRGCACLLWHDMDDPKLPVYYFGRLVESELRIRLLDPFLKRLSPEHLQSIRSGTDKDSFTKFVRHGSAPALGQILQEFLHWNDPPRSGASKRFREWLRAEKPWLVTALRAVDLRRLGDLYKSAKHRDEARLSWDEAAQMARLSRTLLSTVIRALPGKTNR
jgi:tetratricopeptide (TPR) repeat protein